MQEGFQIFTYMDSTMIDYERYILKHYQNYKTSLNGN